MALVDLGPPGGKANRVARVVFAIGVVLIAFTPLAVLTWPRPWVFPVFFCRCNDLGGGRGPVGRCHTFVEARNPT